eukprot:jgi/Chrzof1/8756/Cz03g23110.t1
MAARVSQIYAGTTNGVYKVSLPEGRISHVGLAGHVVNYIFCRQPEELLVACPVLKPMHVRLMDMSQDAAPQHRPGLHHIQLANTGSLVEAGDITSNHIWSGDAHSCALFDTENGKKRIVVGTEPPEVLYSDDGGKTWGGEGDLDKLPSRCEWYIPPGPPHAPHVLGFDFATDGEKRVLLAGVEVGGVLASEILMAGGVSDKAGGNVWEERNEGLCVDVHALHTDPHVGQRLYAVTGGCKERRGGLYVSNDVGRQWTRLSQGLDKARYTVCAALNAYKRGELVVTAGKRPPNIGTEVYRSMDEGQSFVDITEDVAQAVAAVHAYDDVINEELGVDEDVPAKAPAGSTPSWAEFTPVPIFVKHGAVLGMCSGDIVVSNSNIITGSNEKISWLRVCQLPYRITALATDDGMGGSSSVMH